MPTIETTAQRQNYVLSLTLANGVEGYFTGELFPNLYGQVVPGMAVAIAAHEGAAAAVLDTAWRGTIGAATNMQAMLRNFSLPGMEIAIVEHIRAEVSA